MPAKICHSPADGWRLVVPIEMSNRLPAMSTIFHGVASLSAPVFGSKRLSLTLATHRQKRKSGAVVICREKVIKHKLLVFDVDEKVVVRHNKRICRTLARLVVFIKG